MRSCAGDASCPAGPERRAGGARPPIPGGSDRRAHRDGPRGQHRQHDQDEVWLHGRLRELGQPSERVLQVLWCQRYLLRCHVSGAPEGHRPVLPEVGPRPGQGEARADPDLRDRRPGAAQRDLDVPVRVCALGQFHDLPWNHKEVLLGAGGPGLQPFACGSHLGRRFLRARRALPDAAGQEPQPKVQDDQPLPLVAHGGRRHAPGGHPLALFRAVNAGRRCGHCADRLEAAAVPGRHVPREQRHRRG
mmetsp:Transcript_34720/g.109080  ORF Transcript_34720/g.109080 Transcript_34720/m.109080 type:complete len:247 (+) Transcript_34720:2240-2980(+)